MRRTSNSAAARLLPESPASSSVPQPPASALTLAYCRVSTEGQADDDKTSLADQERECRQFAEARGRTVDFVWTDPGVSGRDEDRLERLTTWCEAHPRATSQRGVVVVLNASRWGRFVRRPNASSYFLHRLDRAGWDVEFTQQPKTGHRTTDGVLAVIHDAQAAHESEEKAVRARTGMIGQARLGRWLGRPPFGYDREAVSVAGKRRRLAPYELAAPDERTTLVPGSAEDVRTVRQIFRRAAAGVSLEQIALELNKAKRRGPWDRYPNRCGKGKRHRGPDGWRAFSQVDKILKNRAYIGQLRWWPKLDDGQRAAEPVTVDDAHEPLVSRAVWERVQDLHFTNRRSGSRAPVGRYLLAGMVRCVCGSPLVGGGGQRQFVARANGTHIQIGGKWTADFRPAKRGERGTHVPVPVEDAERYAFYRCTSCGRGPLRGKVRGVTIGKRILEEVVIEMVAEHVIDVLEGGSFDKVLDEELAALRGGKRQEKRDLDAERRGLREERDRLVEKVAKGVIADEDALAYRQVLLDAEARLKAESQAGQFTAHRARLTARERAALKVNHARLAKRLLSERARRFAEHAPQADARTVREWLGQWVSEIAIDGRDPRRRKGRIVLSRVPQDFSASSSGRRVRERRCLPGA